MGLLDLTRLSVAFYQYAYAREIAAPGIPCA